MFSIPMCKRDNRSRSLFKNMWRGRGGGGGGGGGGGRRGAIERHRSLNFIRDIRLSLSACNSSVSVDSFLYMYNIHSVHLVDSRSINMHISISVPVLKSLHWLPIKRRIDYKINSITYKCLHNAAPNYLQELVKPYVPTRDLRSVSSNRLELPGKKDNTDKKRSGARSFKNAAPLLWNNLPEPLRKAPNLNIFKRKLKTHLFNI